MVVPNESDRIGSSKSVPLVARKESRGGEANDSV